MASITFHLRRSVRSGLPGSIFIRVIHERRSLSITTSIKLFPYEWDASQHRIVLPSGDSARVHELLDAEDRMAHKLRRLKQTVAALAGQGQFTVEDVVGAFRNNLNNNMLSIYAGKLATDLDNGTQERTARAYRTAAKGFIKFNKGQDLQLEHINGSLMRRYEKWMRDNGKSLNTISFYMRNLRAIYNKAIREGRVQPRSDNPFAHIYTGVYHTRKRALTKEEIALLSGLDLTMVGRNEEQSAVKLTDSQRDALALFMFGFHARGMSFVDMAYLRRENVQNGTMTYFRRKTGQMIEVKITPVMRSLLRYFERRGNSTEYVFPIIRNIHGNIRAQYESGLTTQNRRLKQLSKLAGIAKNISTHVARHSWATIAKYEKVPLWVISEGLGHANENMTYKYLASFERSVIDRASEKISRAVRQAF